MTAARSVEPAPGGFRVEVLDDTRWGADQIADATWWPAVSGSCPQEDRALSTFETIPEAMRALDAVVLLVKPAAVRVVRGDGSVAFVWNRR